MRITYSAANQAWFVLFGRSIDTASIVSIDGQSHWSDKEQLITDLRYKGLGVKPSGEIYTI